jgi:hypothetical protein
MNDLQLLMVIEVPLVIAEMTTIPPPLYLTALPLDKVVLALYD